MRNAENEGPSCWGDQKRIAIGTNVNVANTLFNTVGGDIAIGDYCIFGHNCMVITGTHDVSKFALERQQYVTEGRDIVIGQGVWIGSGAIVLGPCTIMDHAVIAAGSVVMPGLYSGGWLYAGNPATSKKEV